MVIFRITLIHTFSYEIGSIGYSLYPHGTPFQLRALPPEIISNDPSYYKAYNVTGAMPVQAGPAMP